jgi:hypothetical protein
MVDQIALGFDALQLGLYKKFIYEGNGGEGRGVVVATKRRL